MNPETSIGATLKAARIQRGIPLETIARQTRISKRILESIENDVFHIFPATIYARGFIQNYCDFLGIEFKPLWRIYETTYLAKDAKTPSSPGAHASPRETAPFEPKRLLPGVLFLGALIACAVFWVAWKASHRTPASHTSRQTPAPWGHAPLPKQDLLFHLKVLRTTWMRMGADRKLVFEGSLPPGAEREWKAQGEFSFRAAPPEGIRIWLNGKPLALSQISPQPSGEYLLTQENLAP